MNYIILVKYRSIGICACQCGYVGNIGVAVSSKYINIKNDWRIVIYAKISMEVYFSFIITNNDQI